LLTIWFLQLTTFAFRETGAYPRVTFKLKASLILIWIGLVLSFLAIPLRKRKHLEFSSTRVILGSVLTCALLVIGAILSTVQIGQVGYEIAPFFLAVIFTVAWTSKLDQAQVITVFLSGRIVWQYLLLYYEQNKNGDGSQRATIRTCTIILILIMGVAVLFLNIPLFNHYKTKKKYKHNEEDTPLLR